MSDKDQGTINFEQKEPEQTKSTVNKRAALFIAGLVIAIAVIMFITVSSVLPARKAKTGPTTADGKKQEETLRKQRRDDERKLGEMRDKLLENPAIKRDGSAGKLIREFEQIYDENREKQESELQKGGSDFSRNLEQYARFDPARFPEAGKGNPLAKGGLQNNEEKKSMLVVADAGMDKAHAVNPTAGVSDRVNRDEIGNITGRSGSSQRERASITLSYNSDFPVVTLFEGECLQGVILNEIRSDIQEGPVVVKTTKDFYDESGVYVIMPYGTKVLGRTRAIDYRGQKRLYIYFERIILPVRKVGEKQAGIELPTRSVALDQRGIGGLVSKVNRHFWLQYGSALLLGVLDGLTGMAQNSVRDGSFSVMVDGAGNNMTRLNNSRYSQYASIMPTVTVKPGSKVKIYMTCDINITAFDLKENRPYAASKGGRK